MTKKIGRNDPCPCGSGKKYKKCCEHISGSKRKIQASILSSGISSGKDLEGKASKISTDFFNRPPPPRKELKDIKPDDAKKEEEHPHDPM